MLVICLRDERDIPKYEMVGSHYANLPDFFSWRDNPLVGLDLLIHEVCFTRSHTTYHIR